MTQKTLFEYSLLNANLENLNPQESIQWAESAVVRIFHTFRYILGPYNPGLITRKKSTNILFDKKLNSKPIYPTDKAKKNWRNITNHKKITSDEYLFWGTYFKKWAENDYWVRDEGTLPYAEYVTGVKSNGSKVINRKIMKEPTIEAVTKRILNELDEVYENFYLLDYMKNHIKLLSESLSRCCAILRTTRPESKTKSVKRALRYVSETIKSIEPVYIIPELVEIQNTCDSLKPYFMRNKLKDGGWKHDHDIHGKSNPLNTAEVAVPFYRLLSKGASDRLEDVKNFLIDVCQPQGYWETTRREPVEESTFANAFATNFLIKTCSIDEPIVPKVINRVKNYLLEFDQFDEIHFFACYCQSVRAISNAVKSNCCSSEIIDMLPDIREKIFNTLRGYNEKADVDDNHFKKSIYANTMALLAISYIDDATGDFSSDYRYRLFQNILSNPEIPFPNKVTWYHPVRAKEFTHWLLPWAIGALSKQPFTDSFMLINMCKQIMNHYNEKKGVSFDKNGRYHLWAAGHMLYALLNTLEFFGNFTLYKSHFKDGKFCLAES